MISSIRARRIALTFCICLIVHILSAHNSFFIDFASAKGIWILVWRFFFKKTPSFEMCQETENAINLRDLQV